MVPKEFLKNIFSILKFKICLEPYSRHKKCRQWIIKPLELLSAFHLVFQQLWNVCFLNEGRLFNSISFKKNFYNENNFKFSLHFKIILTLPLFSSNFRVHRNVFLPKKLLNLPDARLFPNSSRQNISTQFIF